MKLAQKKEWRKPELKRMVAGSAEGGDIKGNDALTTGNKNLS